MTVSGSWTAITDSPVGKQTMTIELDEVDGTVTGTVTGPDETVAITDGAVDGDQATWKIQVTKPMKIGMVFTVTVEGDSFSGKVKAGMFPGMKTVGTRS